jgi:hypothetical protein
MSLSVPLLHQYNSDSLRPRFRQHRNKKIVQVWRTAREGVQANNEIFSFQINLNNFILKAKLVLAKSSAYAVQLISYFR